MPANEQNQSNSQIQQLGNWVRSAGTSIKNTVQEVYVTNGKKSLTASHRAEAPPKASAAPTGNNKYSFVGLCDAMNSYEKDLVKNGGAEIANVYEIQFNPLGLGQSLITLPGPTDYSKTSSQQDRSAASVLNPATNSVNMQSKNISVTAGMQIAQAIEMVVRNSSYITNQMSSIGNQLDPSVPSTPSTSSTGNNTSWFKIIVNAVPIGDKIDKKRNDYAYRITYIVTTYAINEMRSQYFPAAQFRGVHKSYDYWFTGKNSQVLNFEQAYNNQYFQVFSAKDPTKQLLQGLTSSPLYNTVGYGIGLPRNVASPPSQTVQQAQNDANTPQANAADFLYSLFDQDNVNITIVGDPAWLFQGEMIGVLANNLQFTGFYPDGTINTETQQVVFAINWNAPADYDNGSSGPYSGTGLMNVNTAATQGNSNNLNTSPPQVSGAYTALSCKSIFKQGKFTQEINGVALKNLNQKQLNQAVGRASNTPNASTLVANQPQPGTRTSLLQQVETAVGSAVDAVTGLVKSNTPEWVTNIFNGTPTQTPNLSTPAVAPGTQSMAPAGDVRSSGVTVGTTNSTGAPPTAAAVQNGQTVVATGSTNQITTQSQQMAAKDA